MPCHPFRSVFSLIPACAPVAADGAAKRRPPKSLGVADQRLESFEDRLRRGEWQAVHTAAHETVIELVTAGSEAVAASNLGSGSTPPRKIAGDEPVRVYYSLTTTFEVR